MSGDGHWWEGFYSGLWLDAQRAMFDAPTSDQHAAFCVRALRLTPGMRVLDAPCGDGRIAIRLARAGCSVTGVDRAQALLDDALTSAAVEGLEVRLERRDVRDLSYDAEFDAALCFWGSFGHFDDVGNVEQARVACRALRPGGRFLIDQPVLETFVNTWEPSGRRVVGGITIIEERAWNAATGCIDCEWTLTRGAERETRRSSIRIYTYREMVHILEAAGFSSFEATGGYEGEEFGLGRRLCLIATK